MPDEFDGPLEGFEAAIDVLRSIEGEQVRARVAHGEGAPFAHLRLSGILRYVGDARAPGRVEDFQVGEAGLIELWRESFEGARLWSFDGGVHFRISVLTGGYRLLIGDADSS